MTRRKLVYSLLGASGIAASYPCYVEPRWLSLTRPQVNLKRARLAEPIRILHLSDLHFSWAVPLSLIEAAVTLGLKQNPDVICLTGDFITRREDLSADAYVRALARLAAVAPTFAVLGNHDGGTWAQQRGGYPDSGDVQRLLVRSGVQLLHNTSTHIRVRNANLAIVGVGDLWSNEIDATAAFSAVHPQESIVLLAHNPDSKDMLDNYPWDLMLSGHTHGGQVILPFDGPRFAPVADKRYVAGLRAWGYRQIHVSRGVGSLGSVRFRCRPDISLLTVR